MSKSELVSPQHLQRKALIYMLSRDFVAHMFAPYAIFARICIAQGNWRWTLQQPLKRWQEKRRLCAWLSCQCHQNHEIIHPTVNAAPGTHQSREPAAAVCAPATRPGTGLEG